MGQTTAARQSTPALKQRRRTIEDRLGAIGAVEDVRRPPPPPEGRLGAGEHRTRRLRDALASLGPVFAGFGRYLSTRVDLLPRRDCLELASIPDRGKVTPPPDVAALIHRELGGRGDPFHSIDPLPRSSTLWFQEHAAWLAPGVPVLVTIVHPDALAAAGIDLPLLPLLEPYVRLPKHAFAAAIHDYSLTLRRRLDLTHQAVGFLKLADDERGGGILGAPVCYTDACSPGVLTLERLEGVTLEQIIAGEEVITERDPQGIVRESGPVGDRAAIARRICAAWIRQAVAGRVVPFEFGPQDVLMLTGNRLVLAGGALDVQPTDVRARFLSYLNAAVTDDPEAACGWVMTAAEPNPAAAAEEELKRRFRQAVPFRDGEWSGDDRLAEQLLVHWRVTREAGWTLSPHQLHLYRGIHAVSACAEALAPDQDLLLAAFHDERLRIGLTEAQQFIDPRNIPATLDKMLSNMVNLPQKLDEVLTLASEGRLRLKLHVPEGANERRIRNSTVTLVSGLASLMGVALVIRHLAPAYGPSLEHVGALLMLAAGAWLLRAATQL